MSLAAASAFLSGANSSSRRTSHAAKLLSHLTETRTDNPRTQGGERRKTVKERGTEKFSNSRRVESNRAFETTEAIIGLVSYG